MDENGVCRPCQEALGQMKVRVPQVTVKHMEEGVVWVDASYRDGTAGLAVAGALGEHARKVEAVSSTQAEVLALRWAMEIAKNDDRTGLTFRTDCQAAWKVLYQTPRRMDWRVELVARYRNQRADYLAGKIRLAET